MDLSIYRTGTCSNCGLPRSRCPATTAMLASVERFLESEHSRVYLGGSSSEPPEPRAMGRREPPKRVYLQELHEGWVVINPLLAPDPHGYVPESEVVRARGTVLDEVLAILTPDYLDERVYEDVRRKVEALRRAPLTEGPPSSSVSSTMASKAGGR